MSKKFIAILVGIVVVIVGVFALTKNNSSTNNNSSGPSTVQPTSHVSGTGLKGVTLLEYGDFQCPACGAYYPIVEGVRAKYGEDIKYQFRNFPLDQIHPNARAAHRAAEAAGNQDKFFDMYHLLYQNQSSWVNSSDPYPILTTYASQLQLDMNKFEADFKSSSTNDIINADVKAGQDVGVNSTPTFFINGQKIDNPKDQAAFEAVIDEAIKAANPSS